MSGMAVNAEITAPSAALFICAILELIGHHQGEPQQKTMTANRLWILHAAVFRCYFGQVTSGEMVGPSSGIRTRVLDDIEPKVDVQVEPHPAPLATIANDPDQNASIIGDLKDVVTADILEPTSGADSFDVAEIRCAVFRLSS